jgi:hypothetical protein
MDEFGKRSAGRFSLREMAIVHATNGNRTGELANISGVI